MSNFKVYRAVISLGKETDTLDNYGRTVREEKVEEYSDNRIRDILKKYTGRISQTPPAFSAIHYKGERLYRKVLRGEVPHIAPREVEIKTFRLLKNKMGEITFEVCASKATYIRSLARDIANSLGTCGHLAKLRRLEIGPFSVKEAFNLNEIVDWSPVIPLETALEYLPRVMVNQEEAKMILNGIPLGKIFNIKNSLEKHYSQNHVSQDFGLRDRSPGYYDSEGYIRMLWGSRLIAIIEKGETLKYFKVFRNYEVVHS
jgi:tRNA pseudouridine55 synthase